MPVSSNNNTSRDPSPSQVTMPSTLYLLLYHRNHRNNLRILDSLRVGSLLLHYLHNQNQINMQYHQHMVRILIYLTKHCQLHRLSLPCHLPPMYLSQRWMVNLAMEIPELTLRPHLRVMVQAAMSMGERGNFRMMIRVNAFVRERVRHS